MTRRGRPDIPAPRRPPLEFTYHPIGSRPIPSLPNAPGVPRTQVQALDPSIPHRRLNTVKPTSKLCDLWDSGPHNAYPTSLCQRKQGSCSFRPLLTSHSANLRTLLNGPCVHYQEPTLLLLVRWAGPGLDPEQLHRSHTSPRTTEYYRGPFHHGSPNLLPAPPVHPQNRTGEAWVASVWKVT